MTETKKKLPRLTVEIDPELLKDIKMICIMRNINMRKYVLRAVGKQVKEDLKPLEK